MNFIKKVKNMIKLFLILSHYPKVNWNYKMIRMIFLQLIHNKKNKINRIQT